jgi:hypothetical protein
MGRQHVNFRHTLFQYDWQVLRISLHENKYEKYKDVHFMLDFIRFYILMNMSAECAFWFLNLKIQGTFKSSVVSI